MTYGTAQRPSKQLLPLYLSHYTYNSKCTEHSTWNIGPAPEFALSCTAGTPAGRALVASCRCVPWSSLVELRPTGQVIPPLSSWFIKTLQITTLFSKTWQIAPA